LNIKSWILNVFSSDEDADEALKTDAQRSTMTEDPETPEPVERAEDPDFLTDTRFDDLNLPPAVCQGLEASGFTHCTPIQSKTLPVSLTGKDIAGQAQTGTGKTAAFLVTIFSRMLSLPKPEKGMPSALIIAPTRELARQIYEEAKVLGSGTEFKMVQVVGGVDYTKQADQLRQGADVVICTPGRIIDYYKQGIFKTDGIQAVVIDEADRLLDLGFEKDMRYILRNLPHYEKRQSMLFSATLSYRVMELTYEYMNLPEFIAVTPKEVAVEGIEQTLYHVGKGKKLPLLLGILARENPHRCLIFVNTKAGVEWLTQKLKGNNWPAEGITGDLPQKKRFKLMEEFKSGRVKILLATDVASRGIHVEDVSHVINYDLPQDAENYIHRIGRTARAGKSGRAISLACEEYVYHLEPLEEMLKDSIPVVWAEEDWFVKDQAGPVTIARKPHRKKPPHGKPRTPDRKNGFRNIPKIFAQRDPDYFPGTFFGFKRPVGSNKSGTKSGDPKPDARQKRRRSRRRRKKPTGGGEVPKLSKGEASPS